MVRTTPSFWRIPSSKMGVVLETPLRTSPAWLLPGGEPETPAETTGPEPTSVMFQTHSEHFETIQHRIYELIRYRSKILSGTLPVDELKEIKRLVTSKIDMGNKHGQQVSKFRHFQDRHGQQVSKFCHFQDKHEQQVSKFRHFRDRHGQQVSKFRHFRDRHEQQVSKFCYFQDRRGQQVSKFHQYKDVFRQVSKFRQDKELYVDTLLDLDMVVRDDQGNIMNPDVTSSIQLYYQHRLATERIKRETSGSTKKTPKVVTQYSHIFFVSVRNFVCKMSEDAELLMTLYDAKEGRAFTENYVVRWSKEGLARDIDQLHNLRVLFTDLGSRDLIREKVYLVCYVVRVGAMEVRDTDHRRSSHVPRKSPGEGMRRPFGVAAMDVTLYLSGRLDSDEEKHHFIPFLQCADKDNLEGTLRRILTLKDLTQKEHKGQGLWTSLKLLHGDIKQVTIQCVLTGDTVREENPHLVLGNVAIARKMGFPEVILPGDVRNDLYLTLVGGEFSKGSKLADKNVEVTVVVCNDKGQSIPGVMSLGGGVEPLNEYRSVIYYHEEKPRWHETFKVAVPIDEFKGSHLRFSFKHRCSTESKDKLEKPFALSYVKLMQGNGTTLHDTEHDLLVYKVDHKFEETDLGYLTLPCTRGELVEGQKPQQGGLTLTNKDSFTIHTNVCSTKLTQNGESKAQIPSRR
uniref:C2 DOCK-type domain-containing protein n=1 Tax=Timema douglasi TaxID=61478 RepID=A0A7R8VV07_TIMDO|nr:unnamed protein product [Timema douglasi]